MSNLTLKLHKENFSIHSFLPDSTIPQAVFAANIYFISKTYDELSIVLPSAISLPSVEAESGWQALEVLGPLDFSLTGYSIAYSHYIGK